MKYCDLHNHSKSSDGSLTPTELVKYAKEKELGALALTDHNTVEGLEEFEKSCLENDLEYIFGSELTTDYNGKEVHLLCMFITSKNADVIEAFTNEQLERKKQSNIDLEKNLRNAGYDISLDALTKKYGKNINRAHFAHALVEKGYLATTEEAFDTLLHSSCGYYNPPQRLGLLDAIKLVKSWGCVPVIAHPLLSVTRDELEELLPKAKENGLVGIEVYYPKFSEEEKNYLHVLAKKHNLVESGGSDYHGNMKSQGDLNEAKAPYSCYENLKKAYLSLS